MATGTVAVKSCVSGKALFVVLPLFSTRNAGRIKDVCALRCKEIDAACFGILERMGALKLFGSSSIVKLRIGALYRSGTSAKSS